MPITDRDRSGRDSAKTTMHDIHSGGANEGSLGAEASWGEEMERNGEDKYSNEPPMMSNQRNNSHVRNQRFVWTFLLSYTIRLVQKRKKLEETVTP